MIFTALLSVVIQILAVILNLVSSLLPTINLDQIYPYIDKFLDIVKLGVNGFAFIAGPLPFILATVILAYYTSYYFIIIPIKYVLRFVGKGS